MHNIVRKLLCRPIGAVSNNHLTAAICNRALLGRFGTVMDRSVA